MSYRDIHKTTDKNIDTPNMFEKENELKHFTKKMIPKPIRRWTLDNCLQTEGSLNYAAVSAIIVCANLIGCRCQVKPKRNADWKVTPNLWGMLIGNPSARKSPVADQFLKPLRKFESVEFENNKKDIYDFRTKKTLRDLEEKAKNKALLNALETGDREEIANAKETPLTHIGKEPIVNRFIINDATIESVGEIMQTNSRTLFQYRDELSGFLASMQKTGREGERSFYLESFQGDRSYTFDRIQRGTIHIECLSIGIFGTIQPGVLAHYILPKDEKSHDGLPQRMQLSVFSDGIRRKYTDEPIDEAAKASAYNILQKLAYADFTLWGAKNDNTSSIPYFSFSSDAQNLFVEWYEGLKEKEHNEVDINIQGHFGKYYSLLPSLALTFFLLDKASSATTFNMITSKYVQLAEKWCSVLESHARKMYALGETYSSKPTLSEKIINFIKKHPEKLPATLGALSGDIRGANAEDVGLALKDIAEINGRTVVRLLSDVQLSNK